jgi:hypothetical protein
VELLHIAVLRNKSVADGLREPRWRISLTMRILKSTQSTHYVILNIALIASVIIIWSFLYNRLTYEAWLTPITYSGDALFYMGYGRAYQHGEIQPGFSKSVADLNAPFAANWNDYPTTSEPVIAGMGWLARYTGIFPAANIMVMLAHILAAIAFFAVCCLKKYKYSFSFAGSILYAFSTYAFYRGLSHITLTYYWHIPILIVITWWCFSNRSLLVRNIWLAILFSFIAGLFNEYYLYIYLQFLAFAVLFHLLRNQWRNVFAVFLMGSAAVIGFSIMQLDTLLYQIEHGQNHGVFFRNLAGLELYGMKLPELFLPLGHRDSSFDRFASSHYYSKAFVQGERGPAYLGVMGIIGFVWLIILGLMRFLKSSVRAVPIHFWQSLWIILFSVVGGINLVLGSLGLYLFRATNRFSIVILALALLFLVRQLSRYSPNMLSWPISIIIIIAGLWDQSFVINKPSNEFYNPSQITKRIRSDRILVEQMEKVLPDKAMVFQLPVMGHPETVINVGARSFLDYEHFRPYLFSHKLHYSYGTDKGRQSDLWQQSVEQLPAAEMASQLESYGFSAILINRSGYVDNAEKLIDDLQKAGKTIIDKQILGDLIAIKLDPSLSPVLPGTN